MVNAKIICSNGHKVFLITIWKPRMEYAQKHFPFIIKLLKEEKQKVNLKLGFFCSSTALLFLFRKARTVSCGRGRRRRRKHQRDGRENHNIALEPTQQVAKMDVPKSYNKTIYILRRSDNPDFHDCSGLYLRSEYNVRKYFRLHLFDYLSSF